MAQGPTYHRKTCGCEGPGWNPPRSKYLCEEHRLTPEERAVITATDKWAWKQNTAARLCTDWDRELIEAMTLLARSHEPKPRWSVSYPENSSFIGDGKIFLYVQYGPEVEDENVRRAIAQGIVEALNAAEDRK